MYGIDLAQALVLCHWGSPPQCASHGSFNGISIYVIQKPKVPQSSKIKTVSKNNANTHTCVFVCVCVRVRKITEFQLHWLL